MAQGTSRLPIRRGRLAGLLVPWIVLHPVVFVACNEEAPPREEPVADFRSPPQLQSEFIRRGMAELHKHLGPETLLYEVRVTGNVFSIQVAHNKSGAPTNDPSLATALVQVDYVESPGVKGQPPHGEIKGPNPVPLKGEGALSSNIFPYRDVHLLRMALHFEIAKLAVDPEAGTIESLVVRRFLPFSEAIRGRIFVTSPRMNGSIDVNEEGYPLKR
jgi:hypothetical protein